VQKCNLLSGRKCRNRGRRLWKEYNDGARDYFLYSDEGLIAQYHQAIPGGALSETLEYGYVPGSQWETAPLFYKSGGRFYWCLNDHRGAVQKLIDSNGEVPGRFSTIPSATRKGSNMRAAIRRHPPIPHSRRSPCPGSIMMPKQDCITTGTGIMIR
jgi:hypothetical protein